MFVCAEELPLSKARLLPTRIVEEVNSLGGGSIVNVCYAEMAIVSVISSNILVAVHDGDSELSKVIRGPDSWYWWAPLVRPPLWERSEQRGVTDLQKVPLNFKIWY